MGDKEIEFMLRQMATQSVRELALHMQSRRVDEIPEELKTNYTPMGDPLSDVWRIHRGPGRHNFPCIHVI